MKTDIFEILKRASVFMILARAVIHFRPSAAYEKYIRLLMGIMTVVILVLPMLELFQDGAAGRYRSSMAEYREQLKRASQENFFLWDSRGESSGDTYIRAMEDEIRDKINSALRSEEVTVREVKLTGMTDQTGTLTDEVSVRIIAENNRENNKITVDSIQLNGLQDGKSGSEADELQKKAAEILQTESSNVEVVIVNGAS